MRLRTRSVFVCVFSIASTLPLAVAASPAMAGSTTPTAVSVSSVSVPSASTASFTPKIYPTLPDTVRTRAATAPSSRTAAAAPSSSGPPLTFSGGRQGIGVTTGPPKVYVVFWGSQWGTANPIGSTNFSHDPSGVAPRVVALLAGIGTNNERWSGVLTQYCEGVAVGTVTCPTSAPHIPYPTGGALAGTWNDTTTAVPTTA